MNKIKILCIGCFHGKIPKKMKRFVQDNKIDLILAHGDFPDFTVFRDLQFKYWNELNAGLDFADIIGVKKLRQLQEYGVARGKEVLHFLNSLGIPVIITHGNHDTTNKYPWRGDDPLGFDLDSLENTIKNLKNIFLIDYSSKKIGEIYIYGVGCKVLTPNKPADSVTYSYWKRLREHEYQKLKQFFTQEKARKTLILSHDPPYGTKLDKITWKKSPRYGEHVGTDQVKHFVQKFQPLLWVCGNIHEGRGIMKIGKTVVVNTGYGRIGQAAYAEIDGENVIIKLINLH
jgi:Icc-related predicted phosphoesterase